MKGLIWGIGALLFICLAALPNMACSTTEKATTEVLQEVELLASTMPLPVEYCCYHGALYEYDNIEAYLVGYDRYSGEAKYQIRARRYCPAASLLDRCSNLKCGTSGTMYLRCDNKDDNWWHIDITIEELKSGSLWWM